jgi:hypothetical protein
MCAAEKAILSALTNTVEVETDSVTAPEETIFCNTFHKKANCCHHNFPLFDLIFVHDLLAPSLSLVSLVAWQRGILIRRRVVQLDCWTWTGVGKLRT